MKRWVQRGGSLLLIADHMPFGSAIADLAFDSTKNSIFRLSRTKGFARHPIFDGRSAAERVDSLVAFTGSALRLSGVGDPLRFIPPHSHVLLPKVAWEVDSTTTPVNADDMLQRAALRVGKGRVVAAGEAAMFSAQRAAQSGARPMGFDDPSAPQNAQFALNVLH